MADYGTRPTDEFWKIFPSCKLPTVIESKVRPEVVLKLVNDVRSKITTCEYNRALKSIKNLENGASSFQKGNLPSCEMQNAKMSNFSASHVTDTVAHWIKKEVVAGPFDSPPLKNFRVNSLVAIDQGEKIRPVLNVSMPKNASFNDNIDNCKVEKVTMSNAKQFSYNLVDSGKGSIMSKFDMVDAYKLIPAPLNELNLQGFKWLEKYFVEVKQIFGAKTSVSNFDIFGNTIQKIVTAKLNIPKSRVHRTLDDVPFVSPANKSWCLDFSQLYVEICEQANVPIVTTCPRNEKAFCNSTNGKVLGILFETNSMSWSLPETKREKALIAIEIILNDEISILNFQKLMGRLNDIALMCPFMQGFKFPLNCVLSDLLNSTGKKVELSDAARKDLTVWKNFLLDNVKWLPIAPKFTNSPLSCKSFSSDAAGKSANSTNKGKIGCGNVGFNPDGTINFAVQLFWSNEVISLYRDEKGSQLGSKTTTLEFLGVLLPFILIPKELCNQHIVVKVDNIGCFFGWVNKYVTGDRMASILVKAMHLICSYLGSQIHIEHLPRDSTWDSKLVDRLSREKSTTRQDKRLLDSFESQRIPVCLEKWMNKPEENWDLANQLLEHVVMKCEND